MIFVFFAGMFLYLELTFQLLVGTFNLGFLRILIFLLMGSAFFAFVAIPMRKRTAFIVSQIAISFFSIIYVSQFVFNRIFHDFYSIEMMLGGGEAISVFTDVLFAAIMRSIPGILLLLLPIAVPAVLYKLNRFPKTCFLSFKIAAMPLTAIVIIFMFLIVPVARDPFSPRATRYGFGQGGRVFSVRSVGLVATMGIDLLSNFIEAETSVALVPVAIPVFQPAATSPSLLALHYDSNESSAAPVDECKPDPAIPHWYGRVNGFDIDFDALIERDASNRALVQMHEYFASQRSSSQNEQTGIFEGFNLITVSAEALSHMAICPQLTPTLYHMQHNGVFFENFYSVTGYGTIGGEVSLLTGFVPVGAGMWAGEASRVCLPFMFSSQFAALGVPSFAYHSGSHTFYNRHTTFPGFGYQFRARNYGLTFPIETGWHTSDIDLVRQAADEFLQYERFNVHFMTLSGHSEYNFGHPIARQNRHLVEHLDYSYRVRAYLATQIELDRAMEHLLYRLEEVGIADRTIIVMTADHIPYGLNNDELSELAGFRLDAISRQQNAAIIYVRGMEPLVVTEPSFVPDLVPTVSNMLGLPFDSRFLSGRDVFSDAMPLAILDSGFVSSNGTFNRHNRMFTPNGDVEVPDGYVDAMLSLIDAERSAVRQIVRLNYFSRLGLYE